MAKESDHAHLTEKMLSLLVNEKITKGLSQIDHTGIPQVYTIPSGTTEASDLRFECWEGRSRIVRRARL